MKLLLFSDLHADIVAARSLIERARLVDVVIGAGDFGNMRRELSHGINVLKAIDRPTVLVAGNNESTEELINACRDWPTAHVLHGTGAVLAGVEFFGIGGGIPTTPFGAWSFDFTEEEAAHLLADCPSGCVLVTHSPPREAVDRSSRGQHLGSLAIRAAIERLRPRLVVCGHIHGSGGQIEWIGSSPVVNAGPAGLEWELG